MTPVRPPGGAGPGPIPSLDGVRAIAVSLVFLAHSGLERFIPGGLGVTVFFVLSGYLITTLMRVEHTKTGHVGLGSFYLRRLLRLMPPLIVVVAAAALLSSLGLIDGGFSVGGLFATLLYFGNYHAIAHDFHGFPAGIGVVWSLAIEEHYYLLYPPLAAAMLRSGRLRSAAAWLGAVCLVVLAWRLWLVSQGASVNYLTMATDTRVDAILVGCVMALWRNPWLGRVAAPMSQRDGALAAVCIAALLVTFLYRDEAFRLTLRFTVQSIAIAGLIFLAVAHAKAWPFRWLNARPLVYLGSISYTVYLSHHLILLGLARQWPQWGWFGLTASGALLTLLVAEPMRRWVEQPCAKLRRRLHRQALARDAEPMFRWRALP